MAVVFRQDDDAAYFSVPIAAVIFTVVDEAALAEDFDAAFAEDKAFMDIDMQEAAGAVLGTPHPHDVGSVGAVHRPPTRGSAVPDGKRRRILHVDEVYVDAAYGGNQLAKHLLDYMQDIAPDNVVYMGFYTGMDNIGMQNTGKNVLMHPNRVRLPYRYWDQGFRTSLAKALPALEPLDSADHAPRPTAGGAHEQGARDTDALQPPHHRRRVLHAQAG